MTRNTSIYYIVADGAHARLFRHDHNGFAAVTEFSGPDAHRQAHSLSSDRPGRAFDRAGAGRHAMEPRTDLQDLAKEGFAKEVAELVNAAAARNEFGQLVLVAPPKTAHAIKHAMRGQAAGWLVAELHADLTNMPQDELYERLSAIEIPR